MNFIGHLYVARWKRRDAGFGLGAMLPDFASMAGVRLTPVGSPELAAGIALHHRTDAIFHSCPAFLALMHEFVTKLVQGGLARGPARAVAHIGVELLLDGELVQRAQLAEAYLSALAALSALPADALAQAEEGPWTRLGERLIRYGIPYDYGDPEVVTARLVSILARRPRLCLSAEGAELVGRTMPDLKARVLERREELLLQLAQGLSDPSYSSTITG